jgi:hypothetical protein
MARRARRAVLLVVVLAVISALVREARRRAAGPPSDAGDAVWPPLADVDVAVAPGPDHSPVRAPGDPQTPPADEAWVLPEGGECPVSHPVKAKVLSGIFHVPGTAHYARTSPDRCYRDTASAEADGLRAPKRG